MLHQRRLPFLLASRNSQRQLPHCLSRPLARGLQSGAVLLGEILTGLIIVVLLTFFLLKDGERMWAYVVRLMGRRAGDDAEAIGRRVYAALAGYVRV